jgi:phage-related protein
MTKLLQDAIEKLKELPESRQNELAVALIEVAEGDQGDYRLTDEQVAEVRRRRANPDRKFVTVAEARKRLRHYGV